MKKKFRKYRIVRDTWLGYEAQVKYLFLPFWFTLDMSNTFSTIEEAEKYIKSSGFVKYVEI